MLTMQALKIVDSISTRAGQVVHEECRRTYVNPIVIKSLKRKSTSPIIPIPSKSLRSEMQFNFKEDCLFCGKPVNDNAKKIKKWCTLGSNNSVSINFRTDLQ